MLVLQTNDKQIHRSGFSSSGPQERFFVCMPQVSSDESETLRKSWEAWVFTHRKIGFLDFLGGSPSHHGYPWLSILYEVLVDWMIWGIRSWGSGPLRRCWSFWRGHQTRSTWHEAIGVLAWVMWSMNFKNSRRLNWRRIHMISPAQSVI